MAYDNPQSGTLKRKRRRREDKPAISARLYLDSNLKGEIGILSEDLVQDLYPRHGGVEDAKLHAALAPWTPSTSPSETTWTVLPFRKAFTNERQLPASTIRFPASALGTQSFVNVVQSLYPNRTLRQNAAIEVRVSDVVPLPLESVFVSVDTEALQKLEDVQKRYGGRFAQANGYTSRKPGKRAVAATVEDEPAGSTEGRRKQLVHDALSSVKIVHTGDMVPLPLTHPVTHASAPPARILGCEPVSQGILTASTKIVAVPSAEKRHAGYSGRPLISPKLAEESGEDEDLSEVFFSATEENSPAKPVVTSKSTTDMSNTEDLFDSSTEESNLSDDSDDMISLAKPGLSDQPSGLSSALTSATPRPFGIRTGLSTPGSVFSNVTSTTVRGGQSTRSKVFRTQGLLEKIPDELLHPRPPTDEDEEARVFVDSSALARLGCFSGDWVKIEAAESHILPQLSAFGTLDGSHPQPWRPVKVYSLPESMSKRPPRYQVNPKHGRRDSISSLVTNAANVTTMHLSPILLANLDQAENVSLSPVMLNKRMGLKRQVAPRPGSVSARLPPIASEVTLRKIVTPLSSERALNHAVFAHLKEHFENKQRIVKAGDLIAIPLDESLGRSIYEGEVEKDGGSSSELLSRWSVRGAKDNKTDQGKGTSVAWFLIEDVTTQVEDHDNADGVDVWGGTAAIDPTKMTMRQSGDARRKLPPATNSTWQYYLGTQHRQSRQATAGPNPPGLPDPPRSYVSNLQRRLRELISVSTSPRAVHLGLPPLTVLLKSTQRSIGKAYTVQKTCEDLGMHYFPIDAYDIISESGSGFDTQAQGLFEARCERALDCGPEFTAICIRHLDTITSDRVAASLKGVLEDCRVLIATTTDADKIPDSVRGMFTHELEMSAPDEGEREGILKNFVSEHGIPAAQDVDLAAIALKTAALVASDLIDVVERAIVAKNARLELMASKLSENADQAIAIKDITLSGGASAISITPADFDDAVDFARKNFADSIGAPKIPNVQWSDVGGLTHVKHAVIETIQLPLSRPELFAKGLKKRSGILFYGPPGTGKTLLAKAIATEFSLNFFSVKGPELLNMYIGESEANVRRVFQRARDARPCVVFFDELDSVAPKRGNQGDSGGVMDRIVSQLLAELDGMSDGEETGGGVFVIGATNRPDLLDQALLRPGRFDKMLYLGISDTHEKQATILQALTRKFTLDPSLSLARVAETLPFTFTGADLYALCSDAMLKAVTRSARLVDNKVASINQERVARGQNTISIANFFDHYASDADTQISIVESDFTHARDELAPSVSVDELRHYERVRNAFEGARKDPEPEERKALSKPSHNVVDGEMSPKKSVDLPKRANGTKNMPPTANGSVRFQEIMNQARGGASDADDDYVVRANRMSLNASPTKSHPNKGKGKAKIRDMPAVQETSNADGSEDLYD